MYILLYQAIWLFTIYSNSHVFTEIIMSTKFMTKTNSFFFELVLRLISQSVLQNPVYKANPQ